MQLDHRPSGLSPVARQHMNQVAFSALIGAGLMLFVGFGVNLVGVSGNAVYDNSTAAFTWTMKVGGLAMLAAAALCYAGWRPGLLIDAILAAAIGASMAVNGAIWLVYGNMMGILLLVFTFLFLHSAKGSWEACRFLAGSAGEVPVNGPRTMEEAASVVDADRAADRAKALKRVMAGKSDESSLSEGAPIQSPGEARPAARNESPAPPPSPPVPKGADEKEPPPGGFLAELGQDPPEDERK
jgi:hypothetical protein